METSELSRRLRSLSSPEAEAMDDGGRLTCFVHAGIEAADEIERLQRECNEADVACHDYAADAERLRARAEAAERALSTARAEVWRTIDTAPKDGQMLLVARFADGESVEFRVVFYDEDDSGPEFPWTIADGACHRRDWPTHWMPLPEPPALRARAEKEQGK